MAVLNQQDFLSAVHGAVQNMSTEDATTFMENMVDTYNDMTQRLETKEGTDWEKKYHDSEEKWFKMYSDRFTSNPTVNKPNSYGETGMPEVSETERQENIDFSDLFSEK